MTEHFDPQAFFEFPTTHKEHGNTKALGSVHDQRFYATRFAVGHNGELKIPFAKRHFNALVSLAGPIDDATMRSIALQLLQHGMRQAICHGEDAERLAEIIDELTDDHDFNPDGRTVFSSAHDDEPLAEVVEFFILPNDLADTGLFVVVGGESSFKALIRTFAHLTADMRERIFAGAV